MMSTELQADKACARRARPTSETEAPGCIDRGCGRTEPDPYSGSCDADVLRASEVQHSVQHVGRDGHLAHLSPVRLRRICCIGGKGRAARRLRPAQAAKPKIWCTKDCCAGMSSLGTARTGPLASITIASMPASVRFAVQKP